MSNMSEMSFSFSLNVMLSMSKMSKIDQIHLRAVMLCMSKMLKEHTDTFMLITFLILNQFFNLQKSFGMLRLRAFQPYHQILCILKHVEDVEDRSNAPKGCNAMYVKDVEDGKRTHRHIYAHNFLNIQLIFNPQKVLEC